MLVALSFPANAQEPIGSTTTTVEYDAESDSYVRITKLGDMVINREYLTFEEYQDYQMNQLMKKYWNDRSSVGDTAASDGLLSRIPGFSEISRKVDGLLAIPDISISAAFLRTHSGISLSGGLQRFSAGGRPLPAEPQDLSDGKERRR